MIAKNFSGYMVIIVVMNFRRKISIAKIFPSKFPVICANIFQRKIIPVYSNADQNMNDKIVSGETWAFFTILLGALVSYTCVTLVSGRV